MYQMRNIITTIALVCLLAGNTQNNPLINYPSLSPDGNKIAFNYQGDIWTATIDGEELKRLTIHEAYDTNPVSGAKTKKPLHFKVIDLGILMCLQFRLKGVYLTE
jgi:hypothetical protein